MRRYLTCIALVLPLCSLAFAADDEASRASLKGLRGIYLVIQNLDPPEEQAGLTTADIRTDVELKLRLAGIPVLSEDQWLNTRGGAYLYVKVEVFARADSAWPYTSTVSVTQHVTLDRTPTIATWGSTWSVDILGSVGSLKVRSIRDRLKDQVDQFINAYLAVNPKK